jgi:chorismate dehydratase
MTIKIAASTYLNSAPLIYGFVRGSLSEACKFLGDAAPARCADLLGARAVTAALIPSIEYQRIDGIAVIPDIAVAARQSVRSVVLVSRVPIAEIRSVALDTSSRTSAALVRILLERFYDARPEYVSFSPSLIEMLELHDGALIIGDPAMIIDRQSYYVYDLAQEWQRATGLPFVFAFWAVAEEASDGVKKNFAALCEQSRVEGLAARREIANEYSERLDLPVESLVDYLTVNIDYDLDEEKLAGLQRFYELGSECGLIELVRELKFVR